MIRAVPYTSLWLGTLLWVVVSGIVLYASGYQLHENYLFAHHSAPVTATVERRYTTISHGRHGSTTNYHLQYHYQVGNVIADARTTVNRATYVTVGNGSSLPILYITTNISHNRVNTPAEDSDRTRTLEITLGLTAIDLIVGTCVMIYYVRRNRLNRELLARGVPCAGVVTRVDFDLVGKTRTARYYLIFSFRDQQGGEQTGRTWYLKPGDEMHWREQMPVSVFCDSRDAKKFTVDLTRREV